DVRDLAPRPEQAQLLEGGEALPDAGFPVLVVRVLVVFLFTLRLLPGLILVLVVRRRRWWWIRGCHQLPSLLPKIPFSPGTNVTSTLSERTRASAVPCMPSK